MEKEETKTGNANPQPAPEVKPKDPAPEEQGKIAQLFSKGLSEKKVRKIVREEIAKELDKNMAFFRKMVTAAPDNPKTQIATKTFKGANQEQMDLEVSAWLKKVGALDVRDTKDEKDPMSNFGRIKTVYAVVPKIQDIDGELEE